MNITRYILTALLLLSGIMMAPTATLAKQDRIITIKTVKFPAGKSSVLYSATARNYDSFEYELPAKRGQTLSVRLTSRSTFLYLNVLNKRTSTAVAATPEPRQVTRWSGTLPEDGIYVVTVYLLPVEARRGGRASFNLSLSLSGNTPVAASSRVTRLDDVSGGTGQYFVSDRTEGTSVQKVRLVLNPDKTARIEVSLGGDGFLLHGKWRQDSGKTVAIDITRGLDDGPLKGTAQVNLMSGSAWQRIRFNFENPRQKTRHRLDYQRANLNAASLTGTQWELVEILYNDDKIVRPAGGEKMTATFGTGNQVTGKAGRNRFTGSYTSGADRSLKVGKLAATRMANMPGSIADTYLKDLERANHYLFDRGFLILQLPFDTGIMKFRKMTE